MIERRQFIAGLGSAAAWPVVAQAQRPNRVSRIGILALVVDTPSLVAFYQGLRDLGYIEGQNLLVEYREYGSRRERLVALATELVKLNVDVILAAGSEATHAARQASATVPIVMTSVNPLGLGFIASLARPGGNVTGLSLMGPEVSGTPSIAPGNCSRPCQGGSVLGPKRPRRRILGEGNASCRRNTLVENPSPRNTTCRRL
jgi:putative tryptophan/tyrosine transport system substrate-binding protein